MVEVEVSDKGSNKPACPFKNVKQCEPTITRVN